MMEEHKMDITTAHLPKTHYAILIGTYFLHALFITAPIAALINWIELRTTKNEANNHDSVELRQHHRWLLNTFLIGVVFAMVAAGTSYTGIGIGVASVLVAWWLYRLLRGIASLIRHKELPMWT